MSRLRWLTAGESHGPALVATLEGLPAGVPVATELVADHLARRRLGYGRGYYDRAIAVARANGRRVPLVGLAFSVQEVEAIPAEPHDVRSLRREIDDEFVGAPVEMGDDAASFEMHRRLPVHAELAADTHRRRFERGGIAFVDAGADEGVVGPVVEQLRRAGPHRLADVGDRRQ